MKKVLSIFLSTLVTISLFAGKGLVVSQKYTAADGKGNITMTWYVNETQCKMKMDYQGGEINSSTWFIPNLAGGNLISYSDGAIPAGVPKTYYSIPVQNITGTIKISRVSLNRTGETKTISGLVCEKMIIKTNRTITEMWVTTDFKPDYYKFYAFFQNSFELMGLSEENIQGFPMESVTKDNAGTVVSSVQLMSATQSDLSANDFAVPADYKSADIKK